MENDLQMILYKGYNVALDSCFNNQALYIRGFLDGMKYQKDGTIPKSKLDEYIDKLNKNKDPQL